MSAAAWFVKALLLACFTAYLLASVVVLVTTTLRACRGL